MASRYLVAYHGQFISAYASVERAARALSSPTLVEASAYSIVEVSNRKIIGYFDAKGSPLGQTPELRSKYARVPKTITFWNGTCDVTVAL